ncbi:MAG: hypothetical protein QF921_12765 [Pseudomonadales bacterium]|jgi:hypothetical protein|nr:hypothetical protein [Pseudomonadales bacterium]MDP6471471.1 hypothetical protein [Pseudomonadales bacterium]MDP6828640.1 hypothetical protein [Pseudomonadales bacterium]MDP6972359.1 hypothetical protein [Pseudomonadales bacterium]|tara:strand:- start:1345 stop:3594 length:2250 start_codon:yes stop_codon:yes gene_type:complete
MNVSIKQLIRFHVTGENADEQQMDDRGLRPALLAPYRDLTSLRYDYPLILVQGEREETSVRSLSSIVDELLQETAPHGIEGERMRKHCFRLETRIRALATRQVQGSLAELWDIAALELVSESDEETAWSLTKELNHARQRVPANGTVVDCDEKVTSVLLEHLWRRTYRARSHDALKRLDQLSAQLSQILEADFQTTRAARTPESLKGSMGAGVDDTFDFVALSDMLEKGARNSSVTERRRQRISAALAALQAQPFFVPESEGQNESDDGAARDFVFSSCTDAWHAFEAHTPAKIELLKAIATAELEIDNRYDESEHDELLAGFSEASLTQEDLDFFPSYLICMHIEACQGSEKAKLIELLCSGLPMKVLVETDDILAEPSLCEGQFTFGARSQQLATMTIGLNNAFVLQTTSSCLYQTRDRIECGLTYEGPALFSVYAGSHTNITDLPRYLTAASATQSRAFPTFTYDPALGADQATRFDVDDNPQAQTDWPLQNLAYEDEDLQRVSQDITFTFVEFAACDTRYARFFATVANQGSEDVLVPCGEYVTSSEGENGNKVPFVLMVDAEDVLQTCIVDDKLIQAARRCREMWHSLQELGGIHNSHAMRLLELERNEWEQEKEREIEQLKLQADTAPIEPGDQPIVDQVSAPPQDAPAADPEPVPEEPPSSDEAYIETPRCTTCDECTDLNGKLFAYDENKQAYIADITAGSYRELVEAAEICQVAIIHPGKPLNQAEVGLSDLIERAEEFS